MQRPPRGRLGAGKRQRRQLAGGDHLREHHCRRLQRFDFFLRIGAPGAVLHHQHAERVAGAQDRHAEERMVDFFAGFRPEGKGRMRLRVGEVDGARLAGDQSDQALVRAQHGAMHRVAIETFSGVEFERGIDAQHVDGADLRHHVGGDQHDDLVKAFLRADRLRHDFAESAQQHARTAERATHGVRSLGLCYEPGCRPCRPGLHRRGITPEPRPAANILKAISNAACKPQAKDSEEWIVRRSEIRRSRPQAEELSATYARSR